MAAGKKYKLFKVCKELNLGMETLSSFLQDKGVELKGPNTSFSQDIYEEILAKFARDKEMADKLHRRKSGHDEAEGDADGTGVTEETGKKKTSYMEAIERSIEEGVEKIQRGEAEAMPAEEKTTRVDRLEKRVEAVEERKAEEKKAARAKAAEPKVEKVEQSEVVAVPASVKEEKPAEKKEEPIRTIDLDAIERQTSPKKSEPAAAKAEKKKAKPESREEDQSSEDDAGKARSKDKKAPKEDKRKEKDEKRRKALEMVRRDEKRSRKPTVEGAEGEGGGSRRQRSRKQKKKNTVDQKEVQQTVKKTLASIDDRLRRTKRRKKIKEDTGEVIEENVIYASEFISANDLSKLMDVPVTDIIKKCLELGLVVSINQRLDLDTIELLAGEWEFTVVKEEEYAAELLDEFEEEESDLPDDEDRAPIITIMGHVDHGKTSLLDYIRQTNVVAGESGGITQHIGAYEVEKNGKKITFLDTPGHEAFTAMRARGAQVTDIVILVIAADDDVKPQTDEAIDHAKAAGVRLIIAINKIDKPEANPERIRKQLADRNILVEDWGGEVQTAEISAKTGLGVDELLEKVLLESEMLSLKANSKKKARGTVIESRIDKGKGSIATLLVQNGTLSVGDAFLVGQYSGRVRALLNEAGEKVQSVGPSQPIQVLGFEGLPQAGDVFAVMSDERAAREISGQRQRIKREQDFRQVRLRTLDQISESIKTGGLKELRIIVKADVDGSAEALADSLLKISNKEVAVQIMRKAVGPISESDVLLAAASNAIIIGFHVRPNVKAKELASQEDIEIRMYKVVYDAINDVRMALEGMLGTDKSEEIVGTVEIREVFKISRLGTIAGCHVKSGKIMRNSKIRLIRNEQEIYTGTLASLKRFKEDVREVLTGFECGLQIQNYNDIRVDDMIEVFEIVEKKRTLDQVAN
jgi:translation initiation factor IF-2